MTATQQHFNFRERTESENVKIEEHDAKVNLDNVPVPKDMTELIALINVVFEKDIVNVEYVLKLLANYKSNPSDWRKYAKYDPHKYTRNLIDEGNGKFNIMLLCWAESQASSIHDHNNAHCFMKCLDGELLETKYEWPTDEDVRQEKPMVEKCRTVLCKNGVCYINDSIGLHRVENESHTKPAVTLHIYIPAYTECKGFDLQSGKNRNIKVTFYSKYGSKVLDYSN